MLSMIARLALSRRSAGLLCLLGIASACGVSCTLINDANSEQCSSDADCRALGATFAGSFCSERKVCVRDIDYCFTNEECIGRTGVNETVCRQSDHKCVTLSTKQCRVLADPDDIRDNNFVLFGMHGIPSWAPNTQACENSVDMARKEFKSTSGGLPGTSATNGKARPVGFLACDVPIGGGDRHKEVSDHLFLQAPILGAIGPYASDEFVVYGLQKAIQGNVPFITLNEDQVAFQIPGRQGVFHTIGFPPGAVVTLQSKGVNLLENLARTRGKTGDLKLAYVFPGVGVLDIDAALFAEKAQFNSKTASQNGDNFRQFGYGTSSDPNFQAKLADMAVQVRDFAPDIVVFRGSSEVAQAATLIEQTYPGKAYYLLNVEGSISATTFVGNDENLRRRTLGYRPGRFTTDPRVVSINARYNLNYDTGPSAAMRACYDLAYAWTYAAAALGNEALSPRLVGDALRKRLRLDGTEIAAGPSFILAAFAELQAGRNIYLKGSENDLVFDENGQFTEWNATYFCIDKDTTKRDRLSDAGVGYSAARARQAGNVEAGFEGTLTCITD